MCAHIRFSTVQKYRYFLLTSALFIGILNFSYAQARFSAKAIVGLTASQIDGDQSAGYHKVGTQAGIGVAALLKKKQSMSIEMLFTQRGCKNQPQIFPFYTTTLNYLEVPVQWHFSDWLIKGEGNKKDWYRVQFNIGLSYGRLIGYQDKYKDGYGISAALEDLNQNGVCFIVGASYYITKHLGWSFRYNRALNYLYKPGRAGTNYSQSLYEHFLAFQLHYRI